jgi:signal transduction histidine kinase
MRRPLDDRVLGGVAAGLSKRLGVEKRVVRAAFVLSMLMGGVGITLYVLAWLFVPVEGEEESVAARAARDHRGIALALSLVPVLILLLVSASVLGASWLTAIAWPLCIAAGGLVLVWRNVSAEERATIEQPGRPLALLGLSEHRSRRQLATRVLLGVLIAGGGVFLVARGRHAHQGFGDVIAGLLTLLVAAVIVFGPWWLNVARDLVDERQARARAEERADMAARVHDSVLQTLSLIQRSARDPQEVVKLARSQERDLRKWLFEGRVPGAVDDEDTTLSAAIDRIQREVEARHGVPVEAVVVGDCALDDDLRSLVEAGREATVNAAKWSSASEVSIFVEVEPNSVAMYVRDRGKGFDESAIASDRRGISESIRARMSRHGGSALIRSSPGEGTEVALKISRR